MKKHTFRFLVAAAGLGACLAAGAAPPATAEKPTAETVGVYDSRAVAIAFAGTDIFQKTLQELRKRYDKAKASGDQATVSALDAEGQAWQTRLHRQGFSTAPVDDILAHYTEKLARLKEERGLTALVSRWDRETLARHADAEQVDVTMKIVELLHPNERQLEAAQEALHHRPIPLAKLDKQIARHEH